MQSSDLHGVVADDLPGNFTMMQFFEWYAPGEGVHWKKYESEAERLAGMGITACWVPRASSRLWPRLVLSCH